MRHKILEIPIDDLSDSELNRTLKEWINGKHQKMITTPNPEFLLLSRKQRAFRTLLQSSDLSLPDGVGLRFAIAALTDEKLHNRHTGVDLIEQLARLAQENKKHLLLIGGKTGAAEKTKTILENTFPGIRISYFNPGLVTFPISDHISNEISEISPDVVLVALGQNKQELFIKEVLPKVPSIRLAVGIGGAFEMIAKLKPRAPIMMRKMGLEWLWRVMIEPSRIGRILNACIVFPLVVISVTLKQHRFLKACKHVLPEIYRQLRNV